MTQYRFVQDRDTVIRAHPGRQRPFERRRLL